MQLPGGSGKTGNRLQVPSLVGRATDGGPGRGRLRRVVQPGVQPGSHQNTRTFYARSYRLTGVPSGEWIVGLPVSVPNDRPIR